MRKSYKTWVFVCSRKVIEAEIPNWHLQLGFKKEKEKGKKKLKQEEKVKDRKEIRDIEDR